MDAARGASRPRSLVAGRWWQAGRADSVAIVIKRSPALLTAATLLVGLVSLPLSGCYSDVETFAKRGAKAWCQRLENCYRASFDDLYDGDMDRCRDEVEDNILDQDDDVYGNCEYEPDDAKQCVKTARAIKDDCSDEADQLMVDDCYGNALAAVVFSPAEVYHCEVGLQADPSEPDPGALASWPDDPSAP
jgi:hypothetical protein